MKFIQATDMPSSHNFALTGDDHDGSLLCHHDGLNQQVDWASKKGNYLGKMGDAIEAIMTDDKRYDRTSQDSVPLQQADGVIERYKPVGKKIKFWLIGNHELKLHRFGDLGKYMADGIDCPYGTYTSVVEVSDKYGPMYRIFASHGFGMIKSNAKDAEQQQGNMKAALKMKLREKRGDCVVQAMGHTHKLIIVPPSGKLYLYTDENGKTKQGYLSSGDSTAQYIDPDQRWYVNTGSFLKLYNDDLDVSGYAEVKGYDPVNLGYPVIKVRDRKVVSIDPVIL